MYKLLLILSGEHQTLPAAEVKATLEAEGCGFNVSELNPPIMVIELDNLEVCRILEKRLAMTLEGMVLLFKCEVDVNAIEKLLRDLDLSFIENKSIAVRVSRKTSCEDVKPMELERRLGAIILRLVKNVKVNLRRPDVTFRGLVSRYFYFGIRAFEVNRGLYDLRRPRYRPFFHPGSLEPRMCRVFVNLARPRRGSVFLDPFNGTGGLSIEASIIGCQVIGLDIDDRMCHGALNNMKVFNCNPLGVIRGDARKLPITVGSVDSIATDPPYGRSTSLKKASLEDLLNDFLNQAEELLKRGRYLCFAHPSWLIDLKIPSGMVLVEQHEVRVHKSLTRKITILRRV
ncbi:MAG: THUMP domain-containing protein [Candidatus Nezhaarchaeales archaeon]